MPLNKINTLLLIASLLGLNGCAVLTVAGAAVSVAATAIDVTTDVAVAAGKGAVKAGSWAVEAATKEDPAKPAAPAVATTPAVVPAPVVDAPTSSDGLELRPLQD